MRTLPVAIEIRLRLVRREARVRAIATEDRAIHPHAEKRVIDALIYRLGRHRPAD
jgi:hypothetical protein